MADYDRALELQPDLARAHFNKSLLSLGQGDFEKGWAGYEFRWGRAGGEPRPRQFELLPPWQGESLTRQGRLLVWSEQGVGDEILFASIFPELYKRDLGSVVIECRPKLLELFRRSFPGIELVVRDQELSGELRDSIAYQCPAGSLGHRFRRSLADFPMDRPGYLIADPVKTQSWRQKLSALGEGLKVGLSWRSSNLVGDRSLASAPLKDWERLFRIPGIHWISLQYDECEQELADLRSRFPASIHRLEGVDYYNDLDAVAALMKATDMIVTAPTSVSMQAAALGLETCQVSYGPEWQRHGTDRFPWFPAMRCYSRRWDESWDSVFSRIESLLLEKLKEQSR